MIWTVAKKELRGYFNSAVAVIFLASFLGVALYTFFWREKFFARGLADLRPLFEWMPKLLIILVSALAMRLWADERRAGTLEVLLTLPVARWRLVVGKFVAGMLLIAIALGLTLGLPITISQVGNLDTGPVIGGYLAALLLSAAYLSIGMCVSAATDNQIVAFVGTALLCGVAYAIGGDGTSAIGRALGTGARFDSVARGVLDLRDLVYYGSITVIGVALNVLLLGRLTWGRGKRARNRRIGAVLGVALIGANALALNLWLAPISRARLDLTQDKMYSLSSTTRDLVRSLDERLLIRGYFSEKTHPWLAPLIPQIRDLLDEYRIAGNAKLRVEVDPTESDEVKREAKERFNIGPTPLPFTTQSEQSVVNAYFAIAIEYGDQHEVLGIEDLIQVRGHDVTAPEVSLRNLEYQVTSAIKKVIANFSSLDSLFAAAREPIRLTAYITPKTLPDQLKEAPDKLKKVTDELVKEAKGKFVYTVVEPRIAGQPTSPQERAAAEAEAMEFRRKHGARPIQLLGSDQIFYFYLVLEAGKRMEVISPPKDVGEAAFKEAITDALKRGAPGFRKVVGLWIPPTPPPMFLEGMPQQQQRVPPPQTFQRLQKALSESYEVKNVALDARVPDEIEVLVIAGASNLDQKAAESVDQFVMRGGSLVLLSGAHRLALEPFRRGPKVDKVVTGLEPVLDKWGIKIGGEAVLDEKNESFLIEQERDLGGGLVTVEYANKPYSLLVRVAADQLAASVITGGLPGTVMAFASPVSAEEKVGDDEHTVEVLLKSSDKAWLSKTPELPDWGKHPEGGVPGPAAGDEQRSQPLAVAVTGGFTSNFARPAGKGSGSAAQAQAQQQLLEHSPPGTRIAVFGSSTFVSDMLFAQRLNSDLVVSNIQLVQNAIDWAVSDTDLLKIRARTPAARAITVEPDARDNWRNANLVIAFLLLAGVVGLAWFRRRAVQPYTASKEA
jgi:ABC-2 type transport system permease protein